MSNWGFIENYSNEWSEEQAQSIQQGWERSEVQDDPPMRVREICVATPTLPLTF